METREELLQQVNLTIGSLVGILLNMERPEREVYEGWTAKDILGHITFWHESFARNLHDVAWWNKPSPLKGRYVDLNQQGVDEMRGYPMEEVIRRLETAQSVIRENILRPEVRMIPYRKGSRDYTPEEHLDIVNKHIQEHLKVIVSPSQPPATLPIFKNVKWRGIRRDTCR